MATVPNLAQFVIDTFLIFSFLTFKTLYPPGTAISEYYRWVVI